MKLVALCLVKNEERWIWYTIKSILDYVDELVIWDTGSTDQTVALIQSFHSPKIKLTLHGEVDELGFTAARQAMLASVSADWVMLVDGDELWPRRALVESRAAIQSGQFDFLTHQTLNLLGDVYHYQEPAAGHYHIGQYTGHLNIRFVNLSIPGLHFDLPYGHEGFFDSTNTPIQDHLKTTLIQTPYLHTSFLIRSSHKGVIQRTSKFKYELGLLVPASFPYPSSLYQVAPPQVISPWAHRSVGFTLNALWQSPLKYVRRRL